MSEWNIDEIKFAEAQRKLLESKVKHQRLHESGTASSAELIEASDDIAHWLGEFNRLNDALHTYVEKLKEKLSREILPQIQSIRDEIDKLIVPLAKQPDKEAVIGNLNAIQSQIEFGLRNRPEYITKEYLQKFRAALCIVMQ